VAVDAEAMQVITIPAHQQLDHLVQVGDRQSVGQYQPAPIGRMNIPEQ
jgi:hypothetical protein